MRMRIFFFGLALALTGFGPGQISAFQEAQVPAEQDEDVRGAFLTTRPKSTDKPKSGATYKKPSRRRPKAVVSNTGKVAKPSEPRVPVTTPKNAVVQRMGLGVTLFMRDANGLAVRADPTREFRKGDHVRFLLETNVDGFLYIFNTTSGGPPVMLYPDPDMDEAGNYIQSHVPFEIPSSTAAEERLRWLTFDAVPGVEKIHFVFTREPLTGVPTEDDLLSYCRASNNNCPWNPPTDLWANLQKEISQTTLMESPAKIGKAETEAEREAVTRGLGLNRDEAEPSLIMLSASSSKNILVATLELVHKAVSMLVDDEGSASETEYEIPPKQ